jgi:cytochrome P450
MSIAVPPDHVPAGLVRNVSMDFRGPVEELFPRLDALRDEGRVLWVETPYGNGAWLFTRAADVRALLQNPDVFSNQFAGLGNEPMLIPIFLDPPDHTQWRRLLNPLFSPPVVARMEESIRARMKALVDGLVSRDGCDFVAEVSIQFPTRVFVSWIGLPEEETDRFVDMVRTLLHAPQDDPARGAAVAGAYQVLNELVAARMAEPADDLMSAIVGLELDGRPLRQDELFRIAFLLFIAGLDTVAAALGFSWWHLAQTPEDRRKLVDGTVPTQQVVEELLRRHSFVNLPRIVKQDTTFAGVDLKRGDSVIVSLPLASRDPEAYGNAASVDFERDDVRHYALGLGPNCCIGSHLARLEMRISLEEWHARIPDYELDGAVESYAGSVMGVTSLPLRWR